MVLTAVTASGVDGVDERGDRVHLEADSVVLVTQRASSDDLYHELAGGPELLAAGGVRGFYRIGDSVAPRITSEAVFDGHRLAMEIASPNPRWLSPTTGPSTAREPCPGSAPGSRARLPIPRLAQLDANGRRASELGVGPAIIVRVLRSVCR